MHRTLEMTYMAVKFNFQQVLLKTLIPRMNTLKDMAIGTLSIARNIIKYSVLLVPSQTTLKPVSETEANSGFLKAMFLSKNKSKC